MNAMDTIRTIQPKLPHQYCQLISTQLKCETYDFGESFANVPLRVFTLCSPNALIEAIERKTPAPLPFCRSIQPCVEEQIEYSGKEIIESSVGPLPSQRVADGFVIGLEEDGDLMYLDPQDNFSVWIFWHDGGDVVKVSESFEQFISQGTIIQ